MANQSTFPTTLDGTPTDVGSGDTIQSSTWNQYMDAIDQLETKVGVNSSAVTGTVDYQIKTLPPAGIKSRVVQVVHTQTGTMSSNAATIPYDNTIPQITEGLPYMTLAITPTNASNILYIDVVFFGAVNSSDYIAVPLFQDTTANALATGTETAATNYIVGISFRHRMVAGTTSSTTFRVRAGASVNIVTFNGANGAAYYGGTMVSSITITEIAV